MSGRVLHSVVGLGSPETTGHLVHHVVYSLVLLQSSMRVEQQGLVEGLGLVVSVTILRSDDVGVQVSLRFPRGLVEELGVGLEATCYCALSIPFLNRIVELVFLDGQSGLGVGLGSILGVEEGLSEGGAPLLVETGVGLESGFFSVASVEAWPSLVEVSLVSHETNDW